MAWEKTKKAERRAPLKAAQASVIRGVTEIVNGDAGGTVGEKTSRGHGFEAKSAG
jgi:hypothetical protein